jgi:catechol 2,3-dioxygenase-like lactoylglutathione lyase family enzyme
MTIGPTGKESTGSSFIRELPRSLTAPRRCCWPCLCSWTSNRLTGEPSILPRVPIDHIGVNVLDLALARDYYDAIMPMFGFELCGSGEDWFGYRSSDDNGTRLIFNATPEAGLYTRFRPGLQHIAFRVDSRAQVRAAHRWALAHGSEIVNEPRLWTEYHPDYYAVFWVDPNGFKLEAFCLAPQDDLGS